MNDVLQFHNLSTIFISLIGAILLLAIYFNIRKRFRKVLEDDISQIRVDKGLLNLGIAMIIWVLAGLWSYLSVRLSFDNDFIYQLGIHIFSTLNNLFLLISLTYFDKAPLFVTHNKTNIKAITSLIILVAVVTLILYYLNVNWVFYGIKIIAIPDLLLSGFICLLLLVTLYRTFLFKDLKLVAGISVIMVSLMFLSQIPQVLDITENLFEYNLMRIVAKTSLISLFLLLATTWVIDLTNTPLVKEMRIKFTDWSLVQLSIPSKTIDHKAIDFGSKTTQYKNLLKLAIRRKYGSGEDQSILVGAAGEIKNQTYLTRVIDNINEILNLEGDDKLDRRDLFTFMGEGKYRLRVLPDQIQIDPTLLSEFAKLPENSSYLVFCN